MTQRCRQGPVHTWCQAREACPVACVACVPGQGEEFAQTRGHQAAGDEGLQTQSGPDVEGRIAAAQDGLHLTFAPMIDVTLFANRVFTAANLVTLLVYAALGA